MPFQTKINKAEALLTGEIWNFGNSSAFHPFSLTAFLAIVVMCFCCRTLSYHDPAEACKTFCKHPVLGILVAIAVGLHTLFKTSPLYISICKNLAFAKTCQTNITRLKKNSNIEHLSARFEKTRSTQGYDRDADSPVNAIVMHMIRKRLPKIVVKIPDLCCCDNQSDHARNRDKELTLLLSRS